MKLTLALLSSLLLGTGLVSAAPAAYPLATCVVSGNELGSMGKPVTKVYENQEIKLCCKPCIKKFDANPSKYMAKLKK